MSKKIIFLSLLISLLLIVSKFFLQNEKNITQLTLESTVIDSNHKNDLKTQNATMDKKRK